MDKIADLVMALLGANAAYALWVESCHIDACDLVSTLPLSHSRTSLQAERLTVEWSVVEGSGVERSAAERKAAEQAGE